MIVCSGRTKILWTNVYFCSKSIEWHAHFSLNLFDKQTNKDIQLANINRIRSEWRLDRSNRINQSIHLRSITVKYKLEDTKTREGKKCWEKEFLHRFRRLQWRRLQEGMLKEGIFSLAATSSSLMSISVNVVYDISSLISSCVDEIFSCSSCDQWNSC